ncbi:uncharacterized protein LOC117290798 [Asterias rubens]|uniref:uncharacterized protein LOC117290798 n=1 Tax=Asterias rubens TaxID=7604 RepID=UPI001455AC81|nr:uncharacterized protein LOC117290798 [Asterias rubens]
MKSIIIVVVLAVIAYFLFKPATFTIKNDIFMYKSPEEVYTFISDLKRTTENHSTLGGKCTLLKQRTRKNGVQEKLFLVERIIPLFWEYELPFNLETRLSLTKPNEELEYEFAVLRGYLLKLHSRLSVEKREGRNLPGSLLTEELTITCPWLATTFVEKALKDSHKDTLISMRNGIEPMHLSKNREKEEAPMSRKEDWEKKTEKKKEEAVKKGREGKKDEAKKTGGQQKKQTTDGAQGHPKTEKTKKTAPKDAGHQPKPKEVNKKQDGGKSKR